MIFVDELERTRELPIGSRVRWTEKNTKRGYTELIFYIGVVFDITDDFYCIRCYGNKKGETFNRTIKKIDILIGDIEVETVSFG